MNINEIRAFRDTLRKLERSLNQQLKDGTECCGVSLVQCHTLLELGKQKEINLKDLSASLQLDKSTVSRSIDILVKKGLVSRKIHKDNRRYILISLTAKGIKTHESINRLCDKYYLQVFSHIPEEKQKQVMESLIHFVTALNAVENEQNMTDGDTSLCQCAIELETN